MSAGASQSGIGMIEVLIALFVITVGLLAGASMQVASLKIDQENQYRSAAIRLAQTMADSMKGNPQAVEAGIYDAATTKAKYSSNGCLASGCSPTQLANEDLFQWQQALAPPADIAPVLPGTENGTPAHGTISTAVNGLYTISLNWSSYVDGEVVSNTYELLVQP